MGNARSWSVRRVGFYAMLGGQYILITGSPPAYTNFTAKDTINATDLQIHKGESFDPRIHEGQCQEVPNIGIIRLQRQQ